MRQRAADGIGEVGADEHGWIGAAGFEGVVGWQFQFLTCLPPAMLAADDAGDDIRRHARFDFDRAARAFDDHPFLVPYSVTQRGFRVNVGARFGQRFAQTRQGALLAVYVVCILGVGQY